ncbi:MAG TPA: branched-chain-amino-acid transaminase, partial [Polyangiaceae bacterium]|nr:branched-chain-amino-acid transaminase [Polyangiaceae bacterium]
VIGRDCICTGYSFACIFTLGNGASAPESGLERLAVMTFSAIWMNGGLVEASEARVSIFDHGLLYGDGIFEGLRFYGGRMFRLEPHLDRLERSAAAIDLTLPYGRETLREACGAVIAKAAVADGYVRLVVTRGEGDLGLDPRSCKRPTTFLAAAPLRFFDGGGGASVVVASTRQASPDVVDPRVKSLNYLNRLLARLEAIRAGADEAIMLNARGLIAEGTTDNVFVVRGGALLSPPASDGALEGITRDVVFTIARELGIVAREESVGAYDLRVASEAFLVGTGAGLVPVRAVDGRALPACPGPIFRRIEPAFEALVRREGA